MQKILQNKRIDMLLKQLKEEPHDAFLNYALALEYASLNKNSEAINLIEDLIVQHPAYLGAYYQLAQLYEKTGNLEKATNTYKAGIILAKTQHNNKTYDELTAALMMLENNHD